MEGSGNVQCLDVLRSINKEKNSVEILLNGIKSASGFNKNFDNFIANIEKELLDAEQSRISRPPRRREIGSGFAGECLLKTAPDFIGDAFCNARLSNNKFLNFGTLPIGVQVEKIIERSMPEQK